MLSFSHTKQTIKNLADTTFDNVEEKSTAKYSYHPVSLLSFVSKVYEKLVNITVVDDIEKSGLFF